MARFGRSPEQRHQRALRRHRQDSSPMPAPAQPQANDEELTEDHPEGHRVDDLG
jgi:hypothetical protein